MKRVVDRKHGLLAAALALMLAVLLVPADGLIPAAYAEEPDEFVFVPGIIPEEYELEYPEPFSGDGLQNTGELPASYGFDTEGGTLRVLGQSAVKNQGNNGTCWAFGTVGALEANLIKNGYGEQDISEMHIVYAASRYGSYEEGIVNEQQGFNRTPDGGGNRYYFADYMMRGGALGGAIDEATDPYSTSALPLRSLDITKARGAEENKTYTARDYLFLTGGKTDTYPDAQSLSDMAVIKEAIMTYGSVSATMYYTGDAVGGILDEEYYNYPNSAYYLNVVEYDENGDRDTNHLVMIVGWDDDYPVANFNENHRPPANGAWLVKNSWGTEWGSKGGYLWISYYDTNFPQKTMAVNAAQEYDREQKVYEYDYRMNGSYGRRYSVARVYTVESGAEALKSVRVFFATSDAEISIDVITDFTDFNGYTFPTEESEIEGVGSARYPGWYTFDLKEPVPLGAVGSKFAVVIHSENLFGIGFDTKNTAPAGTSYHRWSAYTALLSEYDTQNFCIKAITVPQVVESVTVSPASATVENGAQKQFTATVQGRNNPSSEVIWSVSGNQSADTTIENGLLTVAADEPRGTLTVTATSVADGTKYGSATVTVEAYWQVSFMSNNGVGEMPAKRVRQGESFLIPDCSFVHPNGARFLGWSDDPAAETGEAEFAPRQSYTPTANITLYAIWEKLYTLSYDANGGLGAPDAQPNIPGGAAVTLSAAVPTHADVNGKAVVFLDWTESQKNILGRDDPAGTYYRANAAYTMPAHDVKLYALWGIDENRNGEADALERKYSLIYSLNGGYGKGYIRDNLLCGESVSVIDMIPLHEDEGNTPVVFIGWADYARVTLDRHSDARPYYSAGDTYIMPDYNVELYALWGYDENANGTADTLEEKYTVRYTDGIDGAAFSDEVYENLLAGEDTPAFGGSTVREYYTFIGWEPELEVKVSGNAVYTAKWRLKSHTVSFDAGEGTGSMPEQTGDHGSEIEAPECSFTPPDGKVFDYWSTQPDGSGNSYQPGDSFTLVEDITLYAVWKDEAISKVTVFGGSEEETPNVVKLLRWDGMDAKNTGEPTNYGYDPSMISLTVGVKVNDRLLPVSAGNIGLLRRALASAVCESYTRRSGFAALEQAEGEGGAIVLRNAKRDLLEIRIDQSGEYLRLSITSKYSAAVRICFGGGRELLVVTPGDCDFNGVVDANDWGLTLRYVLEAPKHFDRINDETVTVNVNGAAYNLYALMADMTGLETESALSDMVSSIDWSTLMYLTLEGWKK